MNQKEELVFNFNPLEKDLQRYFDCYDYRNIGGQQDDIVDLVVKMFAADNWRWVSVEAEGQTVAVIPMPCDDGTGFSFKVSRFKKKNAAAFILFTVLSLIHSNDSLTTDYEQDFIDNLEKKAYLILEPAFNLVNKTIGVNLGELFSKATGIGA